MKQLYTFLISFILTISISYGAWASSIGGMFDQVELNPQLENQEMFISKLYPNPVKEKLTIDLNLKNGGKVNVKLYDILGNVVMKKETEYLFSGNNKIQMDLNKLNTGIYILRIEKQNKVISKRIKKQ